MRNYSKINKRKIICVFLLTFNQLILSAYTFNNLKKDSFVLENINSNKQLKILISTNSQGETNFREQEAKELEKFVEETFDKKNFDKLRELQESNSTRNNFGELDENLIKKMLKIRKQLMKEKYLAIIPKIKMRFLKIKELIKKK